MQALRDICAGKIEELCNCDFSNQPHSKSVCDAILARVQAEMIESEQSDYLLRTANLAEVPICGKTWWEDGEQYECLMDKGHKALKCGQRGMVRKVEN
jgi:hypothetical protein